VSPFEAAAVLESLHEGRALLKGDWNLCWARLAVSWQVQEAVLEYAAQVRRPNTLLCVHVTVNGRAHPASLPASRRGRRCFLQVTEHFNRLLAFVQDRSWRTSPNVLVGARVAVFRKGSTATPTVMTGYARAKRPPSTRPRFPTP
jgi:hypothetical protein